MWIERHVATSVYQALSQFPVVVLTGARQAGKTSLARRMLPRAEYVTLDIPMQAESAELDPAGFFSQRELPLILDEIQYVPDLFRYLKVLVDLDRRPGQYLITGSQDFLMMQGVSESLAGRCAVLTLPTLALDEVHKAPSVEMVEGFCWRGGHPELWDRGELNRDLWLGSYLTTYLERDVRNIARVGSLRDFDRFLRAAAQRCGQLLSLSELARDVGVAPNTVKSWVSILESSEQVFLLEPYFVNAGKRLIKTPKLYFCDTGMLLYLLGFHSVDDAMASPVWGSVWENFVVNELRKARLNRGERRPFYFWRTAAGQEVDLVIELGPRRLLAVECKSARRVDGRALRGVRALRKAYGADAVADACVVCRVEQDHPLEPGGGVRARPIAGPEGVTAWLARWSQG